MDHLRPLTRRLAELLASEDGTQTIARLQTLALAASRRPVPVAADSSTRLGIWEAVPREDGAIEFERSPATAHEWRYWADVERIPAKSGRRVVLLGESVARGYLFDPAITPAQMLAGLLNVEVVDLARTDLAAVELPPLVDALPALEPDAVVLLTGNNWHNLIFELEELQLLADAVRDGGYARCRELYLERILATRARATLGAIAESVDGLGVPVCLVVPEFNLRDWRGEPSVLAPVLAGDGNPRWLALRERALSGDTAAARAMIDLDGGTTSLPHELLAAANGDARTHLEAARDAVCGLLIAHSPRCPRVVQDAMRAAAAEHGFRLVDLPSLFAGRGLAGRELFLDYCHLTVEGMRIAMGAVARALGGEPNGPVEVDPDDEAIGHVLAAIHNAHYGQPVEVIRHHCERAAALSEASVEELRTLVELQTRAAEPWLCAAFEQLRSPAARRYLGSSDVVRRRRLADFGLSAVMAEAAGATGRLEELLLAEHGEGPVDLLDPRYRATTFRERGDYRLGPERAFHQALAPVSRFHVVRSEPCTLLARLTARLPAAEGTATVRVNGRNLVELRLARRWFTHELELPLARGLNVVELEWPPAAPDAHVELERAARRLERGVYPDALPAFGEVYAFTVG